MKKRLILASLGVMAILVGLAAFAANTAQWVNVQARMEKEIEVACVKVDTLDEDKDGSKTDYIVHPNGCDFGVVFPENTHERYVELTASNSFVHNQTYKSSILFRAYWECKQYEPDRDLNRDGIPDCRVDAPKPHTLKYDSVEKKWVHADQELDGMIRDYITIKPDAGCLDPSTYPVPDVKHLKLLGQGILTLTSPKCFYDLVFEPPACEGHFNPFTDPAPAPKTVKCEEKTSDLDPQKWDRWADLGDEFKIQVYDFGTEIP
jgi:hypothetical protein